jgi:hypothetical protein
MRSTMRSGPGVRRIDLGERESSIPAYRTGRQRDIVIQPGAKTSDNTEIIGLELSRPLINRASRWTQASGKTVSFIPGSAETMPPGTSSVDTVVATWTMCTKPDAGAPLAGNF